VGNKTKVAIPEVIVKWITYALVLHIVALVLAAASSLFGLLAHVREFSMVCFSSCTSGVGAAVTLLAFIFDIAFFFLAKSRLNAVKGGSASIGNAIWLTLAAWILLFLSGCFYGLGRCCISRRPRFMSRDGEADKWVPAPSTGPTYEEQMRLDAVKAEADRKAQQKQGELGLPAFPEYDPTQPLTADVEHEAQPAVPYRDAGYAAAPTGTRAVDEYYNTTANNVYPPRRQATASSDRTQRTAYNHSQQTSGYAPSGYAGATAVSSGPALTSGYLNVDNAGYQHGQYPSQTSTRYEQYANNVGRRETSNNVDYEQNMYSPCKSCFVLLSNRLKKIVAQTTTCGRLLGLRRRTIPVWIPSGRHTPLPHKPSIWTRTMRRASPNLNNFTHSPTLPRHNNRPHHTIPHKPKRSRHPLVPTRSAVVVMATTACLYCTIPNQTQVSYRTQVAHQ